MSRTFIAAHIIVHGIVQGVGFREWTCQTAKSFKLRGVVRNLSDGTVEIVLEGTQSDVDAMIHQIKIGPRRAQIDKVDVERGHVSGQFSDFFIER